MSSASRPTTQAKQTPESLESIAANLEHHAIALRAAATLMRAEPPIAEITVEQEANRVTSLERLGKWVPLATQAAFTARINASQNGVRSSDTGSPKRGKKS